jgi:hypothetical protein
VGGKQTSSFSDYRELLIETAYHHLRETYNDREIEQAIAHIQEAYDLIRDGYNWPTIFLLEKEMNFFRRDVRL